VTPEPILQSRIIERYLLLAEENLKRWRRTMAEPELPPKSAKIALILVAILAICTFVGMGIYLNGLETRPTNQPSTQTPEDNTKQP
jgi:hypothetical protein